MEPRKSEKNEDKKDDKQESSSLDAEGMDFLNSFTNSGKNKYDEGILFFQQKNFTKAFQLFQESADLGYAEGQYYLAECYRIGLGAAIDVQQALRWYGKAADQDNINAQYNLAAIYRLGNGVKQDHKQAFQWYLKAAMAGDAECRYFIAEYYRQGSGIEKDLKQAAYWYEQAKQKNHVNSIYKLANCYMNGEGVDPDIQYAINLLGYAARLGHPLASLALADYYVKGERVPKNIILALELYKIAADAGYVEALYKQGLIIEKGGDGVEQDLELAKKYFFAAAERGYAEAIQRFKEKPFLLIEKMNINSFLLAMRYKDSMKIVESKEEKDVVSAEFQAFVKAMLLGYGTTHSAQGSGLFIDFYQREATSTTPGQTAGIATQRHSKLFESVIEILPLTTDKNSAPLKSLPVSDSKSIYRALTKSFAHFKASSELEVVGRKFPVLYVSQNELSQCKRALGQTGQYPSRDSQLWIAANDTNFKQKYTQLFEEMNPTIPADKFDNYLATIPYQPSNTKSETIKLNILKTLKQVKEKVYSGQQFFYVKLFENLIQSIDRIDYKEEEKNEQTRLAFSRIEYILNKSLEQIDNYEIFLTYIEYAFDEIIFLHALPRQYKAEDIIQNMKQFIMEQYMLDRDDVPTQVALSGSGMNILSNIMSVAVEEINGAGKMYVQSGTYFEIPIILGYRLGAKIPKFPANEMCITFDSKESKMQQYDHAELVDIMVCGFLENVSIKNDQFGSKDVPDLIGEQLKLREKHTSDKPLIVVIDTTMNAFDDHHMSFLLTLYDNEIKSGKIAILTAHSLNKYFHMGFDKIPAGMSAGFYNSDRYPMIEHFYRSESLGNYSENDPTPQMISSLVKYASPEILKFDDIIHGNSRYVHEKLVPKELMAPSQLISVYQPYTADIYQDIWGFLTFKINPQSDLKKIANLVKSNITKIFSLVNIKGRDGYGFSKTKFNSFDSDTDQGRLTAFRISIGTESPQDLEKMLKPLLDYFSEVNEIVALYAKRLPGKCMEELQKINEKYLTQLKMAENVEIKEEKMEVKSVETFPVSLSYEELLKDDNANPHHIYQLAVCYDTGEGGVAKDEKKAELLYEKSVKLFNKHIEEHSVIHDIHFTLGLCYEQGKGTAVDLNEAVSHYQIAGMERNVDAIFRAGLCHEKMAQSIEDNEERKSRFDNAFHRFSRAAKLDQVDAQYKVAEYYEMGTHEEKNRQEAVAWYRIAAKQNDKNAVYRMAQFYENGLKDEKEGQIVEKNIDKAISLYAKAAQLGHVDAKFKLAACYQKGIGIMKDEKKAEQLSREAEKLYIEKSEYQEHALYKLAFLYEKGEGLFPKDEQHAVELYRQAADHAEAQYRLGLCLQSGIGVKKDDKQAMVCFEKAAAKDHIAAQKQLKKMPKNDPVFREIYKRNI